jgi:hypothetical protein
MMAENEPRVWNGANLIITAMAGLIAVLVAAGFASLSNKVEIGDAAIYSQLAELKNGQKSVSECLMRMQSDITRIDTLQKMRLEREARDEQRKGFNSK